MPTLVLLGDSVIDNGAYVAPGDPDVTAQVSAALPGWSVRSTAADGATAASVLDHLCRAPLEPGDAVVLSAGGNDALRQVQTVQDEAETTFAAALAQLRDVREAFRADYTTLLDALADGRPVLVATVYDPAFSPAASALQAAAEGGLSAYNDVIQAEALARRFALLDLRRLFTAPEDYANPIEPSATGGAKIAAAVAAWCATLNA